MTDNSIDYWDHWYENELKIGWIRQDFECYDKIAESIKSKAKGRLVDYGTGRAFFLEYMHNRFPDMTLFGCDHSGVAMVDALKRMPFLAWTNDINLYPEGFFDVVCSIHTLEHFEEPEKILKQLSELVAKDGFLAIVMPLNDREYSQHVQIWHLEDMIRLFNSLGSEWTYRLTIRQQQRNEPNKILACVYPDDLSPMMETIAILKRTGVEK